MKRRIEKFHFVKIKVPGAFGREIFSAGPFEDGEGGARFIIRLDDALKKINAKHKEKHLALIDYELKSYETTHRGSAMRTKWTAKHWAEEIELKWNERKKHH